MFVVFALIATVPLVALSYLALSETRSALQDEVGRAHEDTARAAAAFVGAYVENAQRLLASEAARGNVTPEELSTFQRATLVFSDVHPARLDDVGPTILLAKTGNASLAGALDVALLQSQLQGFTSGTSEAVILTDPAGRLISHPAPEAATAGRDWSSVDPVRTALPGRSGHSEFTDPITEKASVAGFASVPRVGWVVLDEVPTSEAYAPLTRLTALLIVLSGILVGAVLLASVVLARRIVRPVREITSAAGAIAAGRTSERIDVAGDDEIGRLASAFNEMASRVTESLAGLRRSEARYRSLVESANDVILAIEADASVSFVGPLAERQLGWSAAELTGKDMGVFLDPSDGGAFEGSVRAVLDRGEPALYVLHKVVTHGGEVRAFRSNITPIFGPDGKPMRALVVSRDITTERREERFRESSFQMARLVSAQADLDALARDGLVIALAAASAAKGAVFILQGAGLREVARRGETWDAESARKLAEAAVASRQGAAEGKLRALPLLERGEAVGALVLADMQEPPDAVASLASQLAVGIRRSLFEARLKEYAAELESRVEARTAELQAKSQEMESFLYSVSHDLKAPLISIEGYAQGLEEDYGAMLKGDGALYLERIRKNASLMEALILDILELSRIGRIREATIDVDMEKLLSDLKARVEDRFAAAGGELVLPASAPRVRGERNRIDQLFTNLVENALKYRHPARPPRVRIEAESSDGAVFRVIDNGRGIPAAAHEQLFNIFQRLPTPDGMNDPGGTGMGLAIVKRIVDTHGGKIWVGSIEGEGTVFNVALPEGGKRP